MTIQELQPYLAAFSAALSVATLGFILNLVKSIRDNAQDRINIQEERIKLVVEDQKRTEQWAEKEKTSLKEQLDKAKSEMDALLKSQGIDLASLAIGKQLSESASAVRETAEELIKEMQDKIERLIAVENGGIGDVNPDWELSLAMGAMAAGSYADAAGFFDTYSKVDGLSWEASFARGVAHANVRRGFESDLASLRAYNEAIALAPSTLDKNKRARLFVYRGAMLKRLDRLMEAKADLEIALSLADSKRELTDIHYNLACVHAMSGNKDAMLKELREIAGSRDYMRAVKSHVKDYFRGFSNDPDFVSLVSA